MKQTMMLTIKARGLVAILIAAGLPMVFPVVAQAIERPRPGRQWEVKNERGFFDIRPGTGLTVTVEKQAIVFSERKGPSHTIAVGQVSRISYYSGTGSALPGGKRHFVTVAWQERGETRKQIFQVGGRKHYFFLEELKSATGKDWGTLTPCER